MKWGSEAEVEMNDATASSLQPARRISAALRKAELEISSRGVPGFAKKLESVLSARSMARFPPARITRVAETQWWWFSANGGASGWETPFFPVTD